MTAAVLLVFVKLVNGYTTIKCFFNATLNGDSEKKSHISNY